MSWLRVRELVRKEFIQLFRDRKNRPMLVIAPLIQMILFGYVVTTDVRDIRVALIDQARTPESRRLIDAFDGNATFRVTHVLQDPKELDRLLLRRRGGPGPADPAGLRRPHPRGRDGRGADPGRRQHEQHGGRAHRLQRRRCSTASTRSCCGSSTAGASTSARSTAGSAPGTTPTSTASTYYVPGIVAFLVMLLSLLFTSMAVVREKEAGHHGAAHRDPAPSRPSSSSARPSPSS
ncbi:MAG: hypothetical protein MZW92_21760 [Comamonadaceae bacterium]|nr:hypothetical protein [Comamonadaceae bacterium]